MGKNKLLIEISDNLILDNSGMEIKEFDISEIKPVFTSKKRISGRAKTNKIIPDIKTYRNDIFCLFINKYILQTKIVKGTTIHVIE